MTTTILNFRRAAVGLLMAGLAAVAGAPAHAQNHPVPVIAVLDVDALLQESLAAKGVRLEREKYATTYGNQLKDIETKLRAEDQDLTQQRGVLAPDVFQQRAQDFQKKLADYQGQAKEKQERLDYAFQQAMNQIGNTVLSVANETAKAQGFNMVMAKNQVMVVGDANMDITKSVLEKLNQRLPSVVFQDPATLQIQAPAGAPGAAPAPAAAAAAPKAPAKK